MSLCTIVAYQREMLFEKVAQEWWDYLEFLKSIGESCGTYDEKLELVREDWLEIGPTLVNFREPW